jgi:hypothetical protein
VHVDAGTGYPRQLGIGISDEAQQRRHPDPLPDRDELSLAVVGPEWNASG